MMAGKRGEINEDNPNMAWAEIFVEELARCGLKDICIAPGSRSTPLTLAFFAHPDIRIHSHLDERSAGFFGLGMALAKQRPVALLSTSGTAGANFFPAIIEANMSQVPLLVLTADRPPELRHSGANQTIDQVKMFGEHVLWAVDVPLPERDYPKIATRNLRTLAARALATTAGLRKGPVHLNFPFRKPLEPASVEGWQRLDIAKVSRRRPDNQPFTKIERGEIQPSGDQIKLLANLIASNRKGVIVCGPRCPTGDFPRAVSQLARLCGYPLFADPLSGVRFGPHVPHGPVVGGYETFLRSPNNIPQSEVVFHFGAEPVSKRLNQYLAQCDSAVHIHVRENGVWADAKHLTSYFLQADPIALVSALEEQFNSPRESTWLDKWLQMEEACWADMSLVMDPKDFDGAYVADLLDLLNDGSNLFTGNSLPVRHVDQFGRPNKKRICVYGNRGASGIDGNISTGLGIAANGNNPTTILTGDITFYHDSNGLLALRDLNAENATFIVLNNDGGGIFQRLPIVQFEPPFRELFQASHGLDISSIARTYGLEYHRAQSRKEFRGLLAANLNQEKARLIEIRTDPAQDNKDRNDVESGINDNLNQIWV